MTFTSQLNLVAFPLFVFFLILCLVVGFVYLWKKPYFKLFFKSYFFLIFSISYFLLSLAVVFFKDDVWFFMLFILLFLFSLPLGSIPLLIGNYLLGGSNPFFLEHGYELTLLCGALQWFFVTFLHRQMNRNKRPFWRILFYLLVYLILAILLFILVMCLVRR